MHGQVPVMAAATTSIKTHCLWEKRWRKCWRRSWWSKSVKLRFGRCCCSSSTVFVAAKQRSRGGREADNGGITRTCVLIFFVVVTVNNREILINFFFFILYFIISTVLTFIHIHVGVVSIKIAVCCTFSNRNLRITGVFVIDGRLQGVRRASWWRVW